MRNVAMALCAVGLAGVVIGLGGAGTAQGIGTCRIADPTGTPLNVRQGPQGRVMGTLRNGTVVRIAGSARDHKGQVWVQIVDGDHGRSIGWVLRAFVACY